MSEKADITRVMLGLLSLREPGETICPSDVARNLWPGGWRHHMDDVRDVGRDLAAQGKIEVTQKGERVDPHAARGAIRYRFTN